MKRARAWEVAGVKMEQKVGEGAPWHEIGARKFGMVEIFHLAYS